MAGLGLTHSFIHSSTHLLSNHYAGPGGNFTFQAWAAGSPVPGMYAVLPDTSDPALSLYSARFTVPATGA